MKIRSLSIQNFKGVRSFEASFLDDEGKPRPLTALFGDNGSGKTTVLQAIALVLSLATRRTRTATGFQWHGYLPERVSSMGPTRVEMEVGFDAEEIAANVEILAKWTASQPQDSRTPLPAMGQFERVTLVYEGGSRVTSPQGDEGLHQFYGRAYVNDLLKSGASVREAFARVGDVYWFDQYRNLGSTRPDRPLDDGEAKAAPDWRAGVEALRDHLVGMWAFHALPEPRRGRDYIPDLEARLATIFPGTRMQGVQPKADAAGAGVSDYYVLLERQGRVYDIAEMSSGEQAVFALIYEFVRLNIRKSVVLIDELELHLFPTEQQGLLFSLQDMGPDCQFVVTSHSDYLSDVIPTEHTAWLRRTS